VTTLRQSPHVRPICCPSTLLLVALFAALAVSTRWFTLNTQRSVPLGIYRLRAVPPRLERGMLVRFPAPPVTAPWHARWIDLLKPIAALPGDQVCVLSAGLWVNGEPYGKVYTEAHGKQLPRIRGCFDIQAGQVFVATKTIQTLDSRYLGSVPVEHLSALATPVWTWQ
jgi:type IV secretory pathway protease TraF